MSKLSPIPPKLYRNMLADNYKQSRKDYQKILEFQRSVHNPICQKEDRYIKPKTRGNVVTQEYYKRMMEKPEKAHIKRIPLKNNLTSGMVVITEPDKPRGKMINQYQAYRAASAQRRHLGKKMVTNNYKKLYHDDFEAAKLNQTDIKLDNQKKVRKIYLI
jgi:PHD/YefM family antitoxin component YafN of YafNO toxin-antitoxin module